jgi:ArsR family transcriptional regulator
VGNNTAEKDEELFVYNSFLLEPLLLRRIVGKLLWAEASSGRDTTLHAKKSSNFFTRKPFTSLNVLIHLYGSIYNNMSRPLDTKTVEKIAKALGDRNRLLILQKIARQGCVGCCQMQEVVALAQPSVSHHVKVLADAGLVHADKSGRNVNLSLNREGVQALIDFLTGLQNGQTCRNDGS